MIIYLKYYSCMKERKIYSYKIIPNKIIMQLQNFNNFITLTYLNHIIIIRIINHFSYEGVQVVIKKVHKTHTHIYIHTKNKNNLYYMRKISNPLHIGTTSKLKISLQTKSNFNIIIITHNSMINSYMYVENNLYHKIK